VKRDTKEKQISALDRMFKENDSYFLLDYERMTVAQAVELRKALRRNSYAFKVVKNRLALRALGSSLPAELGKTFKKTTAIAFAASKPVELAKMVREFSNKNKILAVKGGVIEGQAFPGSRFEEICRLSSREELLSKVGFFVAYPLTRFLRTWQAPLNQCGVLLSQLKNKKIALEV